MNNLLSLFTLLLSCYLILRTFKPTKFVELILISFLVTCSLIIMWGYILAGMNQLGSLAAWRNAGLVTAILLFILYIFKKENGSSPFPITWNSVRKQFIDSFNEQSRNNKFIITLPARNAERIRSFWAEFASVMPVINKELMNAENKLCAKSIPIFLATPYTLTLMIPYDMNCGNWVRFSFRPSTRKEYKSSSVEFFGCTACAQ